MSYPKALHCIVDDTALITNIDDIEAWVLRGAVHLVIPLHTLERLHLLKKDPSQIGQNARKAVKFLDDVTSNSDLESRVVIQGPDDKYPTWAEVEKHYAENALRSTEENAVEIVDECSTHPDHASRADGKSVETADPLPQMLLDKLEVGKRPKAASPTSTPPLSPSSSGPQSSKTSPEVKNAEVIAHDISPVPQTLKPLINPVVWYTYQMKNKSPSTGIIYLTNSSDNTILVHDFGVVSKNIHQLRTIIGVEDLEAKNHDKYLKKHGGSPKSSTEPKTLFRYEDDESEEDEVVFKPRGRGTSKAGINGRGGNSGSVRSRKGPGHSPANSLSPLPNLITAASKPQIPIGEIDPDSFDRGSFGRGSQPLAVVGNVPTAQPQTHGNRGHSGRGNGASGGQSRGGAPRGGRGGFDRGSARGRGRLFVP